MGTLVMMGAKEPEPIAVTQAKAVTRSLRKAAPAVTVRREGAVVRVAAKGKAKR